MEPLVVIGGGGHAKVVIELLEDSGAFEIAGCIASGGPESVLGVPVLGDDSCLARQYAAGIRKAFVAVGDNSLRRRLSKMVADLGFQLVNAVSPRATVSRRAELRSGIAIMAGAVINSCSRIGSGCIVNTGAVVDHDCLIADWAHVAPGSSLAGNVSIGEGAFLGVGTRVIPHISIGAWATVGAGAVVIRDVPSGATAVGVPAKIIASRSHRKA